MTRNDLRSTAILKSVMADYYRDFAGDGPPVAWCTSVGPAEILHALGFRVFFPENHGAMLGASRMANPCMIHAHARGYSPDICSYLTADVGAYLTGQSPLKAFGLEGAPKADVLVFNTNQCRDVRDWFEFFGREWNVPVMGVVCPRSVGDISPALVDGVAGQFEDLVAPLEAIAGAKLDAARLAETMRLSSECSARWKDCLDSATHRPSPLSFFDGTIQMGPAVVMRGRPEPLDYYKQLHAELQERIAANVAAVPGEQYRLYWDGMPIWGKLRTLSDLTAELSACVVASTYCNSWVFEALDAADPFRAMARASLELFIARSESEKERVIEQAIEKYRIDGVIFHDARTCPNNSNARYGMPNRLRERLGVPVLTIDGDLNDLRCYSEEQTHTNIEGFIEQLETGRQRAR